MTRSDILRTTKESAAAALSFPISRPPYFPVFRTMRRRCSNNGCLPEGRRKAEVNKRSIVSTQLSTTLERQQATNLAYIKSISKGSLKLRLQDIVSTTGHDTRSDLKHYPAQGTNANLTPACKHLSLKEEFARFANHYHLIAPTSHFSWYTRHFSVCISVKF